MKAKIETIEQLRAERLVLISSLEHSKNNIRQDIYAIREELQPAKNAINFLGNFFTHKNSGILNTGIGLGIDMIVKNGLMANSSWINRLIVPFLLKNVTSNVVHDNQEGITNTIFNWLKKLRKRKKSE
ncbi:hypothetical protein SAMN04515674_11485 [Pseudarcicella hirudinis]|uniref:Uncharacterized protein n=1 Tax=Pseudarcicella hirudinis TaxID=1079859 RepID=A0A1I5XDQ1_9BACT|nr:hypothetical protein [Pseudarcicella hirudinis]SFQ30105.1 hypothetical protein SAMN04515674_11485 [Pseudarcicella hirudinis]